MLKKENRIRLKKDFDQAFKGGRSFYGKMFNIRTIYNNKDNSRFGIIISNKITKKAVERNKLRRFFREEIKKNINKFDNKKDYIIIVKPIIKEFSNEQISFELNQLILKSNSVKNGILV